MTQKPAIVEAAQRQTVYEAAQAYSLLGISVIPCHGKEPAVTEGYFKFPWRDFTTKRANLYQINTWHRRGWLRNVGIVCGAVSGNLVVIDLDGLDAIEAFSKQFPRLLHSYSVGSGSGKEMHIYLRTVEHIHTTRVVGTEVGNIELRSDGAYVIAPPSVHPVSNRQYEVAKELRIRTVDTLKPVEAWIKELIAAKHGGTMPAPTQPRAAVTSVNRYALAALRSEAAKVRGAALGSRNNALNTAAFKLGRYVRDGLLTRYEVEQELFAAANGLVSNDGELSVLRTIKSGLDAGIVKAGR